MQYLHGGYILLFCLYSVSKSDIVCHSVVISFVIVFLYSEHQNLVFYQMVLYLRIIVELLISTKDIILYS
jgi:hypothetical protein